MARAEPFNPGNYYYVGGNSKFYGAVLMRYRAEDFRAGRACRGSDARLAVRLRRTRALVFPRRSAVSRPRRARRRSDRAAPFDSLTPFRLCPTSPRSLRRAGAHGAGRPASFSAAARRRHRSLVEARARRPGTPFPTRAPARWTRRPAAWRARSPMPMSTCRPARMVERLIRGARRQAHRGRRLP